LKLNQYTFEGIRVGKADIKAVRRELFSVKVIGCEPPEPTASLPGGSVVRGQTRPSQKSGGCAFAEGNAIPAVPRGLRI